MPLKCQHFKFCQIEFFEMDDSYLHSPLFYHSNFHALEPYISKVKNLNIAINLWKNSAKLLIVVGINKVSLRLKKYCL